MSNDPPSPGIAVPGGANVSCDEEDAPPGWARWVTRISLVLGIGALALTVVSVGPRALVAHVAEIGVWFLAVLALEGVITALDARAMHVLSCEPGGGGYRQVLFAQIAGRAVNLVTPAGAIGEATKASILTRTMSTSRAVAAVMFVALASGIFQLSVIAIGATLTALLLPLPAGLAAGLIVTAVIAATIAVTLAVLVRRGMLSSLVGIAVRLRLVSERRRRRWQVRLGRIDERLSGAQGTGRRAAVVYVMISKSLNWGSMWILLAATGYYASVGEMAALVSAGVVIGWISLIVPMGLGVTESGNYALFHALGAPPAHGVALAIARRFVHLTVAAIGFVLIGIWRASERATARYRSRMSRT